MKRAYLHPLSDKTCWQEALSLAFEFGSSAQINLEWLIDAAEGREGKGLWW